MSRRLIVLLFVGLLGLQANAQLSDTLQVGFYNLLNYPSGGGGIPSREDSLEKLIAYLEPDVFMVCELVDGPAANTLLNNSFNANGRFNYAMAPYVTNTSSGVQLQNLVYYNTNKLVLYSSVPLATTLRDINKYIFYYNDPNLPLHNDTIFMDFYVAHLKASSGATNETRRNQEITVLRDHLNTNPTLRNSILGADLNVYRSSEPAYQTITTTGTYPLVDPINAPGSWNNNGAFAYLHTQCTRTSQLGGDGAGGGMDDRFDQILVSSNIMSGANRVAYIPGTYEALGQDGNRFNGSLIGPPANTSGVPASVLNAMYYMSDHLPVVMQLQVSMPPVLPVAMDLRLEVKGEEAFLELFPEENQSDFRFGLERRSAISGEIDLLSEWQGESGKKLYGFVDRPGPGEWQYRGWSLDANGVRTHTGWLSFRRESLLDFRLCLQPEQRDLCLSAQTGEDGAFRMELLDLQGRVLKAEDLDLRSGENHLLRKDFFPQPGIYLLRITRNKSGESRVLKSVSW